METRNRNRKKTNNTLTNHNTNVGDTNMRTHNLFSRLGLAMVAILLLSFTHEAFASGTAAGTTISNQASVNYLANGNSRNAVSNTLNITVGQKTVVNFTFPGTTDSKNTVDGVTIYEAFTVKNSGNGPDVFNLTVPSPYGTWTASIVGASDEIVVSNTGTLTEDQTFSGRIKVVIPAGEADTTSHPVTLTATSTATTGTFVVVNPGTFLNLVWTVKIQKPVLTFSVLYTQSANKIPGETQTFDLTVTNIGTLTTSGTPTITWNYDGLHLTGPVATNGLTQNTSTPGTAVWTISSLAATGGNVTLRLTAVIDQSAGDNNGTGVPYNTTIAYGSTGSQIVYNDGTNSITQNVSASTTFNVGLATGASLTQITGNSSGDPSTVVEYHITVKNTGNASNTYNFTDVKNAGDLDVAPLYSLGSLGSALVPPTTIGQGATIDFYVDFTIPDSAKYAQTIIRDVTVTPVTQSVHPTGWTLTSMNTITTTVTAPNLTINLSDSAAAGSVGTTAHPAPGDVIYYIVRIANSGNKTAMSVSSSDINQHTGTNEYVPSSVEVDPTSSGTFTPVLDGATFTGGNVVAYTGNVVQVMFTSIPAGVTSQYRYRVTVK